MVKLVHESRADEIVSSNPFHWIDNNPRTHFHSKGVFQHKNTWIQFEFYKEAVVRFVEIHNCKDCGGYTLPDLHVQVANKKAGKHSIDANTGKLKRFEECGSYRASDQQKPIAGEVVTIPCTRFPLQKPGKYLYIQRVPRTNTEEKLWFGEVDIYGLNSLAGNQISMSFYKTYSNETIQAQVYRK